MSWGDILKYFGRSRGHVACNLKNLRALVCGKCELEFILKYSARSGGHLACNLKALVRGKCVWGMRGAEMGQKYQITFPKHVRRRDNRRYVISRVVRSAAPSSACMDRSSRASAAAEPRGARAHWRPLEHTVPKGDYRTCLE